MRCFEILHANNSELNNDTMRNELDMTRLIQNIV